MGANAVDMKSTFVGVFKMSARPCQPPFRALAMPPALARRRRVHERRELLPRAARGGVTCARSLLPLVLASRRPHPVFTCHRHRRAIRQRGRILSLSDVPNGEALILISTLKPVVDVR